MCVWGLGLQQSQLRILGSWIITIVVLHHAHIREYLRMDFDGKMDYEWEFWILGVFTQVSLVIYTCLCKKLLINMIFRF